MILLTAFEPFGGAEVNGSLETAKRLAAEGGDEIALRVLPVVRGEATRVALDALRELREAGTPPRLFVALGEAGPEPVVRLEKVYVNWDDYRIPDNAGNQPRDDAISLDGPAAYFATLPVFDIAAKLEGKTPYPIRISLTAGAFLCNHLGYAVSDVLARSGDALPFGFIHVPSWRPTHGEAALEMLRVTLRAILNEIET